MASADGGAEPEPPESAEPGGSEPGGSEPGGSERGGSEPGGSEPGGSERGGGLAEDGSAVLRESLRDLIPDYRPPADPFVRVRGSVRRRRARRRALLVVGSAASVAAIAVAVPAAVDQARPGSGGHASQAGVAGSPTGSDFPSGSASPTASSSPSPAPVYPVARGRIGVGAWSVGSTRLSDQARRCLYADDKVVFDRAAWCFDDWRPGQPVTWGVVNALRPTAKVTAVFGVASEPVAWVEVHMSGGEKQQQVYTARTATDPRVRFFALVLPRPGLRVLSLASFAADGTPVDLIVQQPTAGQACRAGPNLACGTPPP